MAIKIKPLEVDQWVEYRDIWLEALKQSPEAFAADYSEQSTISDNEWKLRLLSVTDEKEGIVIFAFDEDQPVGMIGAYFETNPKFNHIATIWGAYVKPEYRKQGIARDMANELLKRIEAKEHIVKIKTYSITNGTLAVNVYKNFGFDIIGISKKELLIDNNHYDVYIMEKIIR